MIQKHFCRDVKTPEPILQLKSPETLVPEEVKRWLTPGP